MKHAAAEALPFPDASFCAVLCRFTTHHWQDMEQGLREARRVLKPGGLALFVDVVAPSSAACDSWLQTLELLRDISHVRDFTICEWASAFGRAGFAMQGMTSRRLRMEFASWVARTRTPPERVLAIRALQKEAPDDVRASFELEEDGSFTVDTASFHLS